jgi:peptidoglycan hydrolase-like protein with peptidoglycan-binding domain
MTTIQRPSTTPANRPSASEAPASTTSATAAAPANACGAAPAREPDVSERAALLKQFGTQPRTGAPEVPAGPALSYDNLLASACPCGAGEVGPALPPEQLQALKKQSEAVLDAGISMYALQTGQSLEDVARQFDTSLDELKQLNPGLAEALSGTVGQSLQRLLAVPVGDSDVRATAGPVVESGPDAYKLAAPSLAQVRQGQGVIQRGMGGTDVRELQRMLNAQGASPPLALDGKFGPKTEAALQAFQRSNGVQSTGVLGRATLAAFDGNPRPIPPEAAPAGPARVDGRSLQGTAFGNQIGDAAERSARQLNSVGRCALGVNNALVSLGVPGRGHAYQKAEQLAANPRFREVSVSASDLSSLPRGAVVVWGRSGAKPYGHVSVALGDGREASDHIQRQITGGRYGTDFGNGPDPQGRQFRVFLPA